ncbi:YjbQ family protein [Candidatus Woesearchaeota archaeon]|nr:YjbQ family protein [Candidatus Woesearchaeota archaeon]
MKEIRLSTTRKDEIIDITAKVEAIVADFGVKGGICLVYAPHATAAILILEADGAVEKDANRDAPDCAFRSSRNCVLNSLFNLVPKRQEAWR